MTGNFNVKFFTQDKCVKLLQIRGGTPDKYALSLMDALFDNDEIQIVALATPSHQNRLSLKRNQTLLKV